MQVFKQTKKKSLFPKSEQNLVPALVSVLIIFGHMTKIMYDAVKVIHHSPKGALICLFVCLFFKGSETAECGYCDVCDSCVLCVLRFISPLMAAW